MSNSILATRQYLGHTIELRQSDLLFAVSGPEFKDEVLVAFPSLALAQAAVAKRVEDSEKLAAVNCNFSIALLDSHGNRHEITRINRRTGNLIQDGPGSRSLYPALSWLAQAISRIETLRREANEVEAEISPFRIENSRAYHKIDVDEYPKRVQSLLKTVKEKTEAARAHHSQPPAITFVSTSEESA